MTARLTDLSKALLNLLLGGLIGLVLLEAVLQINPTVLLRGMELPFPVDHAITSQSYQIHYSDADLFYWHRALIEPIQPENDQLEARVNFYTDQFGFPNKYPQPRKVDVVVLGRSYSIGGQAETPWPRHVEADLQVDILNLAQAGGGLTSKLTYLQTYGLPRDPDWIVLEVLPSLDILVENPSEIIQPAEAIVTKLPIPVIQLLARSLEQGPLVEASNYIYPLELELSEREVALTFFKTYLEALSISQIELDESEQWGVYTHGLYEFMQLAEREDICLALLLAPTKPDVYFPLSAKPSQLDILSPNISPWRTNNNNVLVRDPNLTVDVILMQENAKEQWATIQEFALQRGIPFINPIPAMQEAVNEGKAPFMQYDSHWSALGHRIVAELVEKTLPQNTCK